MAEQAQSAEFSQRSLPTRRAWSIMAAALVPLLLIMAFLSTQTYFQSGLPVYMSDWQFGRFGQALPIFNIVIFLTVAILLGLIIDAVIRALRRRRQADDGAIDPALDQAEVRRQEARRDAEAAVASATRFGRLLVITGGVIMGMALLVAIWALLLPRGAETVVFGNAAGAQRIIQGRPDGRLMVTAVNDVLLYRDSAFFVPVIDPAEPRTIRQFVEFIPDGSWNGSAVPQIDISKPMQAYRLALPAFTPTLYAENGYTMVKPYEVLTNRPMSVQLPYFITALQLAVIGLIVLGAAWLQWRRARRLQSRFDDGAAA